MVQPFLEMNNPFLWEPPALGRAWLWEKQHEDKWSQHSPRLGSGRTESQGHSWCDTNVARPGQTLRHFHQTPVPALQHRPPLAGLLSRGLWDVQGEWNHFQDLLFTARGAHSVRDAQGNACGAPSESFPPRDHIPAISPQSPKIPFRPA